MSEVLSFKYIIVRDFLITQLKLLERTSVKNYFCVNNKLGILYTNTREKTNVLFCSLFIYVHVKYKKKICG